MDLGMPGDGLSTATEFHEGSTCPGCQRAVRAGEAIHVCPNCGAASHETCWRQAAGCTSYFCRKERRVAAPGAPEIVITGEEARALPQDKLLPPTTAYPPGREGRYPARLSKLALLSPIVGLPASAAMGAAVLAAMGGHALADASWLLLLVLPGLFWAASAAVAAVALARIAGNSMLRGRWVAASALLADVLIVVAVPVLGRSVDYNPRRMSIVEFREAPEELAKVKDPAIRRAMRANVVVHTSGRGLAGGVITGSGVVVSLTGERAMVLTNRHVVEAGFVEGRQGAPDKARIEVIFCSKERVDGEVRWHHPAGLDLVLLECRLQDTDSPAAVPVDLSSELGIGADVFAVGNPMEHGWTYTKGVISQVRERRVGGLAVRIFQTQTPISQGNSGGGLYDGAGRLVGVNTWTIHKSLAEGMSFALAVEAAAEALRPLAGPDVPEPPQAPDAPEAPGTPPAPSGSAPAPAPGSGTGGR